MNQNNKICYLCGLDLFNSEDIDPDHVPPKQFYPKEIRKKHNLNLLTLSVHSACNKAYQKDEDYFVNTIAPLAQGSYSGNEIMKDLSHQFQRPQGERLGQMILKEFESRPSGLYLPKGMVIKRFNADRVWRIIWKITRGLFFKEQSRFLPENTPKYYKLFTAGEIPPPEFEAVRNTPSKGLYPPVFDYRYIIIPEVDNLQLWVWVMLLWSKLIKIIVFHDPDCKCETCCGE